MFWCAEACLWRKMRDGVVQRAAPSVCRKREQEPTSGEKKPNRAAHVGRERTEQNQYCLLAKKPLPFSPISALALLALRQIFSECFSFLMPSLPDRDGGAVRFTCRE